MVVPTAKMKLYCTLFEFSLAPAAAFVLWYSESSFSAMFHIK